MTAEDRAIVAYTVGGLPDDQVPDIISLHGKLLQRAARRRSALVAEIEAIDRAIDMRTYALELLADK